MGLEKVDLGLEMALVVAVVVELARMDCIVMFGMMGQNCIVLTKPCSNNTLCMLDQLKHTQTQALVSLVAQQMESIRK